MSLTKTKPKYQDEEWLRKQYWAKGRSTHKMANKSEANSNSQIVYWMEKYNIPRRGRGEATAKAMEKIDLSGGGRTTVGKYTNREWLKEQYIEEEKTTGEIAKNCDTSRQTIRGWLKRYGLHEPSRNYKPSRKEIVEGRIKCSACGEWLPIFRFHKDPSKSFGRDGQCKECVNKRNREKWTERYYSDATFRLNETVSRLMNYHLKGNKNNKHWEELVGYTIEELKLHLENQFKDNMAWSNYGDWHVDHIKPVSSFNFTDPEDKEFQECWALENLQPLWAEENLAKSDSSNWQG